MLRHQKGRALVQGTPREISEYRSSALRHVRRGVRQRSAGGGRRGQTD